LQPPAVQIEADNTEARLGTAVHEALACYVRGEEYDVPAIAAKHWVDADEVNRLTWAGRRLWDGFRDMLIVEAVEELLCYPLSADISLSGHADVGGSLAEPGDEEAAVIVDWKSGRDGVNHRNQMMGYAWLVYNDNQPGPAVVKIITCWLREGAYDIEDVTPADVNAWEAELHDALKQPGRYGPAPEACRFCPRGHECAAKAALVHDSIVALTAPGTHITDMAPASLVALMPQATMLEGVLKAYREAVKATLAEHGPIPLGDGREAYLAERVRETVNTGPAWDILKAALPEEQLRDALKVDKGQLRKLVMALAERGQKGKAVAALMEQLKQAGAVDAAPYTVAAIRKVAKSE